MKLIEVTEISRLVAALVDATPSVVPDIIDAAKKRVMSDRFGGYGSDFSRDEKRWLDPSKVEPALSPDINLCRDMLIRGEAHFQLSAEFVRMMLERDVAIIGELPDRTSDNPEMRAASSYTTLMCNHELYLFKLLPNAGKARFNRGIPMTQRYYMTSNNAGPFIGYQAKVMAGIGLWDVRKEKQGKKVSYAVRPGPCLEHFMKSYFAVVSWATDTVAKAASRKKESRILPAPVDVGKA